MQNSTESRKPASVLIAVISIVAAAVVLLIFANRFITLDLFLLRCAAPLLVASVEAIALIGTGYFARLAVARMLRVETPQPQAALDLIVGYPLFGAIAFLIGLAAITPASMGTLLLIGAAAGVYALIRGRARARETVTSAEMTLAPLLALAAIGIVLAAAFAEAQAPPLTLDELAYHLAIPRIWVNEGHVVSLPLLSHSFFPLGIESADLPLISLLGGAGGIGSHFLHLAAALATSMLLLRWLRRRCSGATAILAT